MALTHPGDAALLCAAFPTGAEAALTAGLADAGDLVFAARRVVDGQVIGLAAFSRMRAPANALGLAPVATDVAWRRRGVAAALTREGLDAARAAGWDMVFVLGDPAYYGRFGFSAEAASGFASPYAGPAFQALRLSVGAPTSGVAEYAPAFDDLD